MEDFKSSKDCIFALIKAPRKSRFYSMTSLILGRVYDGQFFRWLFSLTSFTSPYLFKLCKQFQNFLSKLFPTKLKTAETVNDTRLQKRIYINKQQSPEIAARRRVRQWRTAKLLVFLDSRTHDQFLFLKAGMTRKNCQFLPYQRRSKTCQGTLVNSAN